MVLTPKTFPFGDKEIILEKSVRKALATTETED